MDRNSNTKRNFNNEEKMKKIKKKFDAVAFQRKVRNKLSLKYFDNPELFEKDMERIRKKYGMKKAVKYKTNNEHPSIATEPKVKYGKK